MPTLRRKTEFYVGTKSKTVEVTMDTLSLHGITLSSVLYLSASYIDTYTRLYRENKGKKIYTLLKVSGVNGDDLIWGGSSLVYPYWAVTLQKKKMVGNFGHDTINSTQTHHDV